MEIRLRPELSSLPPFRSQGVAQASRRTEEDGNPRVLFRWLVGQLDVDDDNDDDGNNEFDDDHDDFAAAAADDDHEDDNDGDDDDEDDNHEEEDEDEDEDEDEEVQFTNLVNKIK